MKSFIPLLVLAGVLFGTAAETAAADRPNIIVILSDDMGYSDIGCYGGEISTPNLDALAARGLRFTQFYNTARCCPTRASLLTGLHPHQTGVGHMMEDRGHDGYRGTLNRKCVTIAEALRISGYRTYAVGKWHVTPGKSAAALANRNQWPLQRGFDRYYGTIHGAGSYFDPSALVRDNALITSANDPAYQPDEYYYTDAIADHAVKFIREHARDNQPRPFFLYTAFTAAHWPLHARDRDIAKYRGHYDGGYEPTRAARRDKMKRLGLLDDRWASSAPAERWDDVKDKDFERRCMEVYAAQVDAMDQGIGRMIAELKARGQFENTLIFYLQDNGGCAETVGRGGNATPRGASPTLPPMDKDQQQFDSVPKQTRDGWPVRQGSGVMPGGPDTYIAYGRGWANVSNTPFREYKHWTHEGGISTPLIVHWPDGVPAPAAGEQTRGGRLVHQPGQLVDIMATCIDVAGARYPAEFQGETIQPLEGTSLRPAFANQPITRTRPLVWEHEGNRAVRDGKWKLVAKENQPWELYDLERDRTETRDLASTEPERTRAMAATWNKWAERANVLPLGTWRGKASSASLSTATRFALKAGDRLGRSEAPAIARRAFRVTANFEAGPDERGVVVAQGGSAHGYALFVDGGRVHFTLRSSGGLATISTAIERSGAQTAIVHVTERGAVRLKLNEAAEVGASKQIPMATMPTDGLDVGADHGGAVGPYGSSNAFTGTIQSIQIELETP